MDVTLTRPCCLSRATRPNHLGHTLAELLMVLAISSILLGLAAPGLGQLVQESRMTTRINLLVTSLNLARSEAVRRSMPVALCKSPEGILCDNGAEWQHGWIVYADTDRDRKRGFEDPILQVQEAYEPGAAVDFASFYSGGRYVYFHSNGFTRTNGTFTFCDPRGDEAARALILSSTGRMRVARETGSGNALRCE